MLSTDKISFELGSVKKGEVTLSDLDFRLPP